MISLKEFSKKSKWLLKYKIIAKVILMATKHLGRRTEMESITIIPPFDAHVHLREGQMLSKVLPYTSKVFSRAIVMGNLSKPIVTAEDALKYQRRISQAGSGFTPIMTIMFVNATTPEIVQEAYNAGIRHLKLIPGGTSTNSAEGVRLADLEKHYDVLEEAQRLGMAFLGHWELNADPDTGRSILEINREERAIPFLRKVIEQFPNLRIMVEHITTKEMVELVREAGPNVGATITAHHLRITRADVIDVMGRFINPHNYCKPVAKDPDDREALIAAAISGNDKFSFGSDSAPHPQTDKRCADPKAGIFSAPVALPSVAQVFEENKALNRLKGFVSEIGPKFYGSPQAEGTIILIKDPWTVPNEIGGVVPFMAGQTLPWRVAT